jgi:phage-related minor tail protein
MDVQAKTA